MKAPLLATLLCVTNALAGLDAYRSLVVSDPSPAKTLPTRGVRITYLGTNAYLLESRGSTVLVDPYFSRAGFGRVMLQLPIAPNPEEIAEGMRHLPRRIDAILATHSHIDHLLDAPEIARRTGALLIASRTGTLLARSTGFPANRCRAVRPGQSIQLGFTRVRVLPAAHDRVLGSVPYPGVLTDVPAAPRQPCDWICGEPLAFLIEMGGRRIYIDSGGMPGVLPPADLGRVDLAIAGVAVGDGRARLGPLLDRLRPRYFLPSHQDDFFRPLEAGFHFGALTDFPAVRRFAATRRERLILLDYYHPWTLR
jgi:L-ascorbate metabolism protein UlaG (beta-lactamase superfamily)